MLPRMYVRYGHECRDDEEVPMPVKFKINGETRSVEGDPETPLLWVLRDDLGLTGTKYGCGAGLCGACTVHVGGPKRNGPARSN